MWIFTETGFLSAVQKGPESSILTVRARDKESISDLASNYNLKVVRTPMADYPYRVEIDKADFANWVSKEVQLIEYSNFKNQVAATRGHKFAKLLGSVWSVMLDAEDEEARGDN